MISSKTFTATPDQVDFPFEFPYLSEADITVTVDDVPTTDWTLTNSQLLHLGDDFVGGGALAGGETVVLSRSTPITSPAVTFASPSTLRSAEINRAVLQLLYNLQEQDEETRQTLSTNLAGDAWDGKDKPVKSLGAPVDPTDAARLSDIDNAIVAGGNIPAFSVADIGRTLGIDAGGNVGWASPGGGVSVFKVPTQATPPGVYSNGGFFASGVSLQDAGSRIALEKVADVRPWFTGTAPSIVGTDELFLPLPGVYEVMVRGNFRSLAETTGVPTMSSVAVALSDHMTGNFIFDQVQNITLGRSGTEESWNGTGSFTLRAFITVTGAASMSLRASKANSPSVVLDTPASIEVREVR